ncbi:ABC transporter substrate-binding protein [Rhizobacter sp. Root1221]|nr:ABC transporter substrate-binding protein [Rhizobacter sp. Root1221]
MPRRQLLQGAAAFVAGAATPLLWAANPLKIGYVSPQSGPLASFGEADKWVIVQMRKALAGGLMVGGQRHAVEIVLKDSESKPARASEVALELIARDRVTLVLTAGTTETAGPVSQACEAAGVPCISSIAPWQALLSSRKGDPAKGFDWTYHMFWGMEDLFASFIFGWLNAPTNRRVGGLFPDDGVGRAWSDKRNGFPQPLAGVGFTLTNPGPYANGTLEFNAQIAAMKRDACDIVTGVMLPSDAHTFLTQARQQRFKPKIVSLGKALLLPATLEELGDLGDGLSTEVWWSPSHPFASSLTGQTARDLTSAYEADTQRQWTQPIGFAHALFEVAVDALKRTRSTAPAHVRDAVAATRMDSIVGPVQWNGTGRSRNISRTPLVLGQWVKGKRNRYDLRIVCNVAHQKIPVDGQLRLLA